MSVEEVEENVIVYFSESRLGQCIELQVSSTDRLGLLYSGTNKQRSG